MPLAIFIFLQGYQCICQIICLKSKYTIMARVKNTQYVLIIAVFTLFVLMAILFFRFTRVKELFATCTARTRSNVSPSPNHNSGIMWKRDVDGSMLLGFRNRAPGSVPVVDFLAETPEDFKKEIASSQESQMCPRQTAIDNMEDDRRNRLWDKVVKTPSKLSQTPPPDEDLTFCHNIWGGDPVMTLGKINCYRKLYNKPFVQWDRQLEQRARASPNSCKEVNDNDGYGEAIVISPLREPTDGVRRIYENEFDCYDPVLEQGLPGCSATNSKDSISYNNIDGLLKGSIKSIGCASYPYCGPGANGFGILLRCKYQTDSPSNSPTPTPRNDTVTEAMLGWVNEERRKTGAPPLRIDDALMTCAQQHSNNMDDAGVFAHQGSSGLPSICKFGLWGENIANARSPEEAFYLWLTSTTGHYENMINPSFTKFGLGVSRRYYTQVFG